MNKGNFTSKCFKLGIILSFVGEFNLSSIVDTLESYFKKMNVNYEHKPENNLFFVYFNLATEDYKGEIRILVHYTDKWVTVVAPLINENHLPREIDRKRLYRKLLEDTFYLNEVTFGMTREGDIVVHAETASHALSYENFRMEFYSVLYGVEYFVRKLVPSLLEEVKKKES